MACTCVTTYGSAKNLIKLNSLCYKSHTIVLFHIQLLILNCNGHILSEHDYGSVIGLVKCPERVSIQYVQDRNLTIQVRTEKIVLQHRSSYTWRTLFGLKILYSWLFLCTFMSVVDTFWPAWDCDTGHRLQGMRDAWPPLEHLIQSLHPVWTPSGSGN